MSMKHLFAAAAVAPLCFAAASAFGQTTTTISKPTNPPLATSTSGNIDVALGGTIDTLVPGAAITVDSNNTVSIEGEVLVRDQPNATGVLVVGDPAGRTSGFTMSGGILRSDDSLVNKDTNGDGNLDGPFVEDPALRYGLRITGPGTFTGDITTTGGLIAIKGNGASAAISIETPVVGNISLAGQVGQLGANSFGIVTSAPVTGNVTIGGSVGAIGDSATAVQIGGDVSGKVLFNGAITVTGFRYPTRPTLQATVDKLGADDLLLGGPGVRITNSVAGGVWFYQVITDTDPNNLDEDGDGIPDAQELTTSSITSSGSAPALVIGGPTNIVLGNNGTLATTNYGLILGGSFDGIGVYDHTIDAQGVSHPIPTQGVVIGGQGGTVDTGNGILVSGSILASSIYSDATAMRLGSGALVPTLKVTGTISAGALGIDTSNPTLKGLQIDAGAQVPNLIVTGQILAGLNGTFGNLTALSDASGTLTSITNYGKISSVITTGSTDIAPVGKQVALDLTANTTGVTVLQEQNPDTTITTAPSMFGDVLFGSGNANLQIMAGSLSGSIAFGTGVNALTIGSGAVVSGGLTNAGTQLTIDDEGTLGITSSNAVQVTSLTTGPSSTLLFTADPKSGSTITNLQVAGTATLANGASIAVGFKSKLPTPAGDPLGVSNLVLINAAGGLTNNGYVASLDGKIPFLYQGALTNNADQLLLAVRRSSAAEVGLAGSPANAFNAFYDNFDKDPSVSNIVLGKTTQAGFDGIYNQFLPDYSGGPFNSLATGIRAIQRTQSEAPVDMAEDQPRSWLQEVGFGDSESSSGSEVGFASAGFAVAAGYEQPAGKLGTVGYSVAILTSDVRDDGRAFGSRLSASSLAGSFYWRKAAGGLLLDASATGGYAWVESTRRVVDADAAGDQNLIRAADGNWYGAMGGVRLGASYEAHLGNVYIRPQAVVDYLYLYESGYSENGGGQSIDLTVGSRQSSNSTAEVGIAIGGRFGRTFHWGPELQVAYRDTLGGTLGNTTAAFSATPGESFALSALPVDKHSTIVRLALKGSGAYANFALEGSAEFGDLYDEYTGRLVVRFIF
jgi:uncharacterized protein YhjY with autotransporter beta-barrel domain